MLPVADAGTPADAGNPGPADAGPADAGPADAGPADAGPADAGPADAGTPADAGPVITTYAGATGGFLPGSSSYCQEGPSTWDVHDFGASGSAPNYFCFDPTGQNTDAPTIFASYASGSLFWQVTVIDANTVSVTGVAGSYVWPANAYDNHIGQPAPSCDLPVVLTLYDTTDSGEAQYGSGDGDPASGWVTCSSDGTVNAHLFVGMQQEVLKLYHVMLATPYVLETLPSGVPIPGSP